MKHKTPNEKLAKSQNREFVNDEPSGSTKHMRLQRNDTFYSESTTLMMAPITPPAGGAGERLLNQNLGKAPPGRLRSPGASRGHPPENKAGPPRSVPLSLGREGPGVSLPVNRTTLQTEKEELIIKNQYSNYYKRLIFTIMKKQILFLMVFVLAALASVNKSYGQNAHAPSPGVAYNYAVTVAGASGATGQKYLFYVTKNVDLVAGASAPEVAGTDFIVNAGATYNDAANTVNHINLTWTLASTTSATAFYLVVKYTENNGLCNVENMKVWQIQPINTFYLAFVPSDVSGATVLPANAQQCVAGVVGATISTVNADTTLSRVTYTYGKNTLYYKITAAGMLGTWRPDISLPALGGLSQVYESVEWNDKVDGSGSWHPYVGAAGTSVAGTYKSADTDLATIADAINGTSYLVRIVIDNKNFETLAKQDILVGVDGYLPPFPSTTSDVISATDHTPEVAFGKTATNSILPRPTVTGTTVTFVQKNP